MVLSGFLGIPLRLFQFSFSDLLMHNSVPFYYEVSGRPNESREKPLHNSMAPVWCACECNTLRSATLSYLSKCSFHETPRVWHEDAGFADFRHCRSHKVT